MTDASVTISSVPDHVPADRRVDVDIYDLPGGNQDPHRAWVAALQGAPALVYTPRNGGHWIVTRGDALFALYRDTENLSNASIAIPANPGVPMLPSEADGSLHRAYRSIVQTAFMPASIDKLEERTRALAIDLIDGFKPKGRCEFISDFGHQLPIVIFLTMMDLPQDDRPMLLEWAEIMTRDPDPHVRGATYMKVLGYLEGWMERRTHDPGTDLISAIMKATVEDRPIKHDEALGLCANLLLGGLDTVASMMGFVARFLAESEGHRRALAENPERIPRALDELTRRFAVAGLGRVVARDFSYDGVVLKKGERLLLPNLLHALDETQFEDPFRVDFDRKRGAHVLSFGNGPHRCIGMYLARMELRIFLEEWLRRIPDFRLDPDRATATGAGQVNAVLFLPLVWDA